MKLYGEIIAQYVMRPDDYELWTRRDNNIFISPEAVDDIIEHYELRKGEVVSFYTLKKRLLTDRDFAELHGLDMSDEFLLLRSLNRLGFISRSGSEDDYETDCRICCDDAKTASGDDIVVMMIVDTD